MEAYLYQQMFELEARHWWFAAKHRIVQTLLERHFSGRRLQGERLRIADLGCGCGRMIELLSDRCETVGVDASPLAVQFCRARGVQVVQGALPDSPPLPERSFDAVLMLDVLEHLDDDVAGARIASRLLKPDGILLATVPAYPWLFGPHDLAHHHRRRYQARSLRKTLEAAGVTIRYMSHYNTLLFPLALLQRIGSSLRSAPLDSIHTAPPPEPINAIFRMIFSAERHLLGRLSLPLGLSLVATATPLLDAEPSELAQTPGVRQSLQPVGHVQAEPTTHP